jgi:type I restriction enzyme, S subunit
LLGALDDKIELNRRMNETLEAMARAIFKDWFVDFGPTRAKQEGRAPYLAPDLWSLFPDRLDDEGKPEGWKAGTLGDVAHQVGESVNPEAVAPITPYIGLEHMPRRSVALAEWEAAAKVTSGKHAFRKGDFLFGKLRPYFHKVGIAPVDGVCSSDIVVSNARERSAGAFVLACISQDEFVAFTDRMSDGTKIADSDEAARV